MWDGAGVDIAKFLGTIITAWIIQYSRNSDALFSKDVVRRKSKAIDDYDFIASFLAIDLEKRKPLVIEQAFYTYFRRKYYFDEIQVALKFPSPMRAFDLIHFARGIISVDSEGHFNFKSQYSSDRQRLIAKICYFSTYVVALMTALLPVLYANIVIEYLGFYGYVPVIFLLIVMGSVALTMLDEGVSIRSAEKLIEEQSKSVTLFH